MRRKRKYTVNKFGNGGVVEDQINNNSSGNNSGGATGTTAKSGINAGAIASGASQLLGDITNNLSVETPEDPNPTATTREELYQQLTSFRDFNPQMNNAALNGLNSGLTGASAGMSAGGPWGALIGGAVGTVGGTLSSIFGNRKRKRAARRYNEKASRIFSAAEDAMDDAVVANSMFNYSDEGGPLFAYGGNFSDGLTEFNSGGSHESNPYGGIMQGIGNNGQPNLVEQGETKYNNFIFSDRLKVNKDFIEPFDLPNKIKNKTYSDASKILTKEAKERPNDPISQNGVRAKLDRLKDSQESYKGYRDFEEDYNDIAMEMGLDDMTFAKGGKIHIKPSKRGTFTAAAKKHGKSVQEFARQVLANKERYSPAMVKKANFARNAAKWHDEGGPLFEDVIQDYALGGMIRNVQNRFNILPDGTVSKFDWGGNLPNTHDDTYKGGFPSQGMGVYWPGGSLGPTLGNGTTMYEKNTIGNSYPGNRTRFALLGDAVPAETFEETNQLPLPTGTKTKTGSAPQAPIVQKKNQPGILDNISNRDTINQYDTYLRDLFKEPDSIVPTELAPIRYGNISGEDSENGETKWYEDFGMFAPMFTNTGQLIGAAVSRPETVRFQRMNLGTLLDDYLPYQPIDREYYANKIREYGRTTDANIMNLSGGNRATATANLLASARNTQDAIGDMYFKADQENRNRYLQSKQFRNSTRAQNARLNALQQQFNSELGIKEDMINASNRAARRRAISEGLSALAGNISDISRYDWDRGQVDSMSDYKSGRNVRYRRKRNG